MLGINERESIEIDNFIFVNRLVHCEIGTLGAMNMLIGYLRFVNYVSD